MRQAEVKGKRFLCRTAAAFVSARIGHLPLLVSPQDLDVDSHPSGHNGGLVVVGSYVPKTTTQVKSHTHLQIIHGTPLIPRFLVKGIETNIHLLKILRSVQVEELRAQCGDFLESITVRSSLTFHHHFGCLRKSSFLSLEEIP